MSKRSTSDRLDVRTNDVVGRRWKVLDKLGEGSFGLVLMVADLQTPGVIAAMKLEVNAADCPPLLQMEVDLMEKLGKVEGLRHVLKVLDRGRNDMFKWMAMDFAGPDISKLRRKSKLTSPKGQKVFSPITCLMVGLQTINALQGLHEVGYIHRDIKPDNLVMDRELKKLCLLDFGMARKFINAQKQHHRQRPRVGFRGTVQYASPWALREEEQSRRDDLFSAILVLVEISTGRLPWSSSDAATKEEMARLKVQLYAKMFDGCEPEIKQVADKIYSLQYADDPDYHGMKVILTSGLRRLGATGQTLFDWEQPRRAPINYD